MRGICGKDQTHKVANTPAVQGSQGHQTLTWDVLTLRDGEVGPIDLLKILHVFFPTQTNSAEGHCQILLLQAQDSENSEYLRLYPVQYKLVLKMRLYETKGRVEIKSLWNIGALD